LTTGRSDSSLGCTAFSRRSMTRRAACHSTKRPVSCGGFAAPGFPDCDAGGSRDSCRTDAHGRTGGRCASQPPPTLCVPAVRASRRHTCRASAGRSRTGPQNALHVRPRSAQRLDLLRRVFGHLAADAHQRHSQGRGHGGSGRAIDLQARRRRYGGDGSLRSPHGWRASSSFTAARGSRFEESQPGAGKAWRGGSVIGCVEVSAQPAEGTALGTLAAGGPGWPGGQADRPGAAACRTRGDDHRPQRRRLGRRVHLPAQRG
jgi:hypothetical protein